MRRQRDLTRLRPVDISRFLAGALGCKDLSDWVSMCSLHVLAGEHLRLCTQSRLDMNDTKAPLLSRGIG